ncbi:hypothetical protein FRC10_006147, partial [Ceratobasidium sp. 414]
MAIDLREVLGKLDRDPSGMLSDFDLFATHNWITAAFFAVLFGDDGEAEALTEPVSKSNAAPVLSSDSNKNKALETSGPEDPSPSPTAAKIDEGIRKYTDFRTGTPTFMSIRVLRVEIGSPYEHHFMDDLESFFWVILWGVAQHVDPDEVVTRKALVILNQLDQSNLDSMAGLKLGMLTE